MPGRPRAFGRGEDEDRDRRAPGFGAHGRRAREECRLAARADEDEQIDAAARARRGEVNVVHRGDLIVVGRERLADLVDGRTVGADDQNAAGRRGNDVVVACRHAASFAEAELVAFGRRADLDLSPLGRRAAAGALELPPDPGVAVRRIVVEEAELLHAASHRQVHGVLDRALAPAQP